MTSTCIHKRKQKARLSLWLRGIYGSLSRDLSLSKLDRDYLLKRVSSEGLSFCTRILPLYSKYTLSCIEANSCHSCATLPTSFKRRKDGAPIFLGLLFKSALEGDSVDVLRIRQLCEYSYKLAMPFSEPQLNKAEQKYRTVEEEMDKFERANFSSLYEWDEKLRRLFESLYPKLTSVSAAEILGTNRPRFGPGSYLENGQLVADLHRAVTQKLRYGDARCRNRVANYMLKNGYSLVRALGKDSDLCKLTSKKVPVGVLGSVPEAAKPFLGYFRSRPSRRSHKPLLVRPKTFCRLAFVPKDSRGPRTISVEPLSTSSIALSFNDYLRGQIERESNGRVRFKDQSKHRELAREGSVTRKIATVDLRDASDRVRLNLIRRITRNAPGLRWGIRHSRTRFVKYRHGRPVGLRKFANMGNGLCFPYLSLAVQLSAIAGVSAAFPLLSIRYIANRIWVYGDDLILPAEWYAAAVAGLEKSWLAVNDDKSFKVGPFRESCGGDYHNGNDVTPVRLRLNGLPLVSEICLFKRKKVVGRSNRRGVRASVFPKKPISSHERVMPVPTGGDPNCFDRWHHCLTSSGNPTHLAVLLERHCRELGEAQLWKLQAYYYSIIEAFLGKELVNVHPDSPYMGKSGNFGWNDNPIEGIAKVPKPVLGNIPFAGACEDRALSRALSSREPLESPFCDVPDIRIVNILNVNNVEATRLQYGLAS